MRKRVYLFWLAFCLLLTACAPAAQPEPEPTPDPVPALEVSVSEEPAEPELSQREKDWKMDSLYFIRRAASLYESDWLATVDFPGYPSFLTG